jgi:hypothetical protein
VFLDAVVIRRLLPLLALGLLATGCPARAPAPKAPLLRGERVTRAVKPAPRRVKPWRYWRDELGRFHTIGQLWNAINRHHDALGYALHPRYLTTRVRSSRRRAQHPGRARARPRPGDPPRVRPTLPPIDRPPVDVRARAPLCRRACNHVRAICYAARRICQIARRLREYRALLTCRRATARCTDARRAARRRCRTCG